MTHESALSVPEMPLREAGDIMRMSCMGAAHQHRLSFKRILLRRLKRENWTFARAIWNMDEQGHGTAVYTAAGPQRSYSLVAFSHYLDPAKRTDRVIAEEWDATFALHDGIPDSECLTRLRANVVKQEAGRISCNELVMARANKSLRMFDHVVDALSRGEQPDADLVAETGYLMRTTAVYGSGKFGAADFEAYRDRPELAAPFQAEMLSVYLIRQFTVDLVEHIASLRSPATAVRLAPELRRQFGVGNATGLGMAPYMVNHPVVLNQWLMVRETALSRVRSQGALDQKASQQLLNLLARAQLRVARWKTDDSIQSNRIAQLGTDLAALARHVVDSQQDNQLTWNGLYDWADCNLSLEAREFLVSLMIECHGPVVDELEQLYHADEQKSFRIDGTRSIAAVLKAIDRNYAWAMKFDFSKSSENARFWYTSEDKLEPRVGERATEEGAELEHPLAVARDIQEFKAALQDQPPNSTLAIFLLRHPQFRHTARRVQISETHRFAEICDNTISAAMRPVDLLRFKLAFFGATRFDPRSDRWVRVILFQDAPFMNELSESDADDWFLPALS